MKTISTSTYIRLCSHLATRHGRSLGTDLRYRLPRTPSTIHFSTCLQVPYHPRYGLVNVWLLQHMVPPGVRKSIFEPISSNLYELRGFPAVAGVHIGTRHLEQAVAAMGLCLDNHQVDIGKATKTMPEKFASQDWYFIAPNESSEVFPVHRSTEIVHSISDSDFRVKLAEFIPSHMHRGHALDAIIGYEVASLMSGSEGQDESPETTCDGSLTSESEVGFRFGTRKRCEEDGVEDSHRTKSWVMDSASRRADMIATVFRSDAGHVDHPRKRKRTRSSGVPLPNMAKPDSRENGPREPL
ncbi:unnamed protein product [Parascedosporium putredinis]|uniref:Uncharacterized protein n=1 Tax=Parascedosporium putredinis TaxID=1442378 RepID=A0A9P1H3A0_9PEZI|nr:unnamed protein product [Parascedosporium putredinis]CAI7994348.1 unnamed protein product [Parascedosporium putredinis]